MKIDLYYKRNKIVSFFILILILAIQSLTYAQSGSLKGGVFDRGSNKPLVGANLILLGSSLGAASDLDGNFIIRNIPEGEQTIIISYIGYSSDSVKVVIAANRALEENFYLLPVTIEGETVTVTGQAQGQLAAINQQLTSNTIKNVVSSEKMHELPDANAAAALSRLPGLSIMEGDKIVIRGIQAKMNTVLINGIQLPSTDLEDRSTNLGFISSNMLSGIEVIKALTPDMDANAIGGVVNLKVREAQPGFHFDMMAQGGYNTQDRTADNYKIWASLSNRFFDDKFGVFVQGNFDRTSGGIDQTRAGYEKAGQGADLPWGEATFGMHDFVFIDEENIIENISGSLILDYKLPQGKIILQNTFANTDNDMARYRTELDFELTELGYALNRDIHSKQLLINALQAEYKFGDINTELSLSHSYSDKVTDLRYGEPGNEFGFKNQKTGPAFESQVTQSLYFTPQDVYNLEIDPDDWKDAEIYGWATTRDESFKQHLYNGIFNANAPITFSSGMSANIKAGGKYTRSTRETDVEESYQRAQETETMNAGAKEFLESIGADPNKPAQFIDFRNYNYEKGKYFLGSEYNMDIVFDKDRLDEFITKARSGWPNARHKTRSERDDFTGSEEFVAGYLMGEFQFGEKLSLIAGLRYEHFNMDYKANFVYVTHSVDGNGNLYDTLNTVDRNDDHFFPNVQLRYKITDWFDVRFAYTNSISRPDYRAILPNTYIEEGNNGQAGNTKLKPTLSTNFDLSFSFYNNELGLLTVGGFYKKLKDVFFNSDIYYQNLSSYDISYPDSATVRSLGIVNGELAPGANISTYVNNPNPAYIKGLEIDWQTNFWYLPSPLNLIVLNVNYTRVWSDMDYRQIKNSAIPYKVGRKTYYHYVSTDTVRNARIIQQGDHIVNFALGIDYKGFSGRISLNYQGDVISSVGLRPEEDQFSGDVYRWDFTLKQKLPIDGLSIALSGINIFHSSDENYQNFRRNIDGPIIQNLVSTTYVPRRFQLNLRYTL